MILYYLMPIVFIVGILAIAFEEVIKINKAATAVGMSILLWLFFLIDAPRQIQIDIPTPIIYTIVIF